MSISVNFLERRDGTSPSIERVFKKVADLLSKSEVVPMFTKARFGNDVFSTLLNLISFRPRHADIFHITGHINYMGLVLPKKRTVLTIHDLTILDHRGGIRRWLIEKLYFTWPSRRLRFLTTISHETKARLQELTGLPDDKIRVIENPLLVEPTTRSRDFDAERPTILQLGTAQYKNLERLVNALAGISCRLQIVGHVSPSIRKQIEELGIDYANVESLTDTEIELAFDKADIVTLCSTNEGFGLPIIEAQARRVVVVTSNRSPMKDVAGGAAYFVDPESVESIRDGILTVISDSRLREELIRRGSENIRRFEPARIAEQYLSFYEEVIANKAL